MFFLFKFELIIVYIFYTVCFCGLYLSLFGRVLGRFGCLVLIVFCQIIVFMLLLYLYMIILKSGSYFFIFGDWFYNVIDLKWSFLLDSVSVIMGLVICLISTLVMLFAYEYMESDPHIIRFLTYLVFFSFFMLFFVFSGNLIQSFLGWEGVGLISFLLVNFWFTRVEANRSAIKAILFNRVGDFCFIFFLVILMYFYKSVDILFLLNLLVWDSSVNNVLNVSFFGFILSIKLINLIGLLIFLAAAGKSAQLGLHAWLPDAMEGPTPVSALLHSATMVTAGVFLLIRFSVLFFQSDLLPIISIIGALTAFISAIFASFQFDLKKIIAYSTCSQLGFMVVAFSTYNALGSFYHLFNHAFFKALLFLCAGSVIHSLSNEQDIRKMGGLINYLPYTYISMFIGSLGLVGFPFFSGFYSKELVLVNLFNNLSTFIDVVVFILIVCSSLLTIFYSYKIISRVFFSSFFRGFKNHLFYIHEPNFLMCFSIFFLSCGSIFSGFFFEDFFIGVGLFFLPIWSGLSFDFTVTTLIEKDICNSFLKFIFSFFFLFLLYYSLFEQNNIEKEKNILRSVKFLNDYDSKFDFLISSFFGFGSLVYFISNFFLYRFYIYFVLFIDRGMLNKGVFDICFLFFNLSFIYSISRSVLFINLSIILYLFFFSILILFIYLSVYFYSLLFLVNVFVFFFLFILLDLYLIK